MFLTDTITEIFTISAFFQKQKLLKQFEKKIFAKKKFCKKNKITKKGWKTSNIT